MAPNTYDEGEDDRQLWNWLTRNGVTSPETTPPATREFRAATATLTNVAGSASSVQLLAANASLSGGRLGVIVDNDSSSACYLKYGVTASTTSFTVKIPANTVWEMPKPIFTGELDIIWDSATGSARVTELS